MREATGSLTYPKCDGEMRTFERNGMNVDHCQESGGILLDRRELERLNEAESSYVAALEPPTVGYPLRGGPQGGDHRGGGSGRGCRRRRGFLGELFPRARTAQEVGGRRRCRSVR